MKNKYLYLLSSLEVIILICFMIFGFKSRNQTINQQSALILAMGDTLQVWKDKDSISHAKISIIETQKVKDFLALQSKDEEIQKLQIVVKEYEKQLQKQGSVTNFETITEIVIKETVKIDTTTKDCNFSFTSSDEWITTDIVGTTIPNSDELNITLSYKVRNEYSVILGLEKKGLFGKNTPVIEIKNYNPYSETTQLRTYQVTNNIKPKRWFVGPTIFCGIGNNGLVYGVGLGIGYSIIQF